MSRRRGAGRTSGGASGRPRGGAKRGADAKGAKTANASRSRARHETSAGGVVFRVVDGEPRYLLIRDSYGHWGFPKGHVERGERSDTAALREVMEETGIRSASLAGSVEKIEWFFRFRGALIHKRCEFFLMETAVADTKPQLAEGITACKWASLDEALSLIEYDNARAVLRRADDLARARVGVSGGAA
ncbi:MAG TPA: NUDIX domain-containing protein [Gemmatimonadaceae bacterium]|nr:NUDIX domain-containing protein [Gemmatimonadaceae bacterium]